MNLIRCVNDCIHQEDGYCTLDKPSKITGDAVDGCCYYQSKSKASAQSLSDKKE